MKNKLSLIISIFILVISAVGCGWFNAAQNVANSNKSIVEQVGDQVAGIEKTGIPECDEVLVKIEKSQKTDDSITGAIGREAAKRTIASQVRENSANRTPQEKQVIAQLCKQIGAQFTTTESNK